MTKTGNPSRRRKPAEEHWTDKPCYYVSVRDAGRTGLVLGPFRTEQECRQYAYSSEADGGDRRKQHLLRQKADDNDPWSWFYSWGMVKMQTGHATGTLNKAMDFPCASGKTS